jgi:hypothetical protein
MYIQLNFEVKGDAPINEVQAVAQRLADVLNGWIEAGGFSDAECEVFVKLQTEPIITT